MEVGWLQQQLVRVTAGYRVASSSSLSGDLLRRKSGDSGTRPASCRVKVGVMLPQVRAAPEAGRGPWSTRFPGALKEGMASRTG